MMTINTWSSSLSSVATSLEEVSVKLQDHFEDLSSEFVAEGKRPIPDPVDLLRRIRALEVATQTIQLECQSISEKKTVLAKEVTHLLTTNASSIQKLSAQVGVTHSEQDGDDDDLSSDRDSIQTNIQQQCHDLISSDNKITNPHSTNNSIQEQFENDVLHQHVDDVLLNTSTTTTTTTTIITPKNMDTIVVTDDMFLSLPMEVRNNVNINHVQQILALIHEEYTARYLNGYRGKSLSIERFQLLKHRNPSLYKVIANTSTWRGVVCVLEKLGLLKVEKDGLLNVICSSR